MKNQFKRLAALISMSLMNNTNSIGASLEGISYPAIDDGVKLDKLNITISHMLAAHRSHSSHASHASHASHRSSSGGGGGYTPPPVYTPPPAPQKADPLGQQPRPKSSYPSAQPNKKLPTDKEALKNIIMRIQLALQFDGYYDGPVDGVMGPKTRESVMKYKQDKGITGAGVLDTDTLNALGIKGF